MNIYTEVLRVIADRRGEIDDRAELRERARLVRIEEEKKEIEEVARSWTDREMHRYMIREFNWSDGDDPPELFDNMVKLIEACKIIKCNYCVLASKIREKKTNVPVMKLKPEKARSQYYIHVDHIEALRVNKRDKKFKWYMI